MSKSDYVLAPWAIWAIAHIASSVTCYLQCMGGWALCVSVHESMVWVSIVAYLCDLLCVAL